MKYDVEFKAVEADNPQQAIDRVMFHGPPVAEAGAVVTLRDGTQDLVPGQIAFAGDADNDLGGVA